jgi:phosphoribosyl-ATP pyrophosphohydrolase
MQKATEELKHAISKVARLNPDAAMLLRDVTQNLNTDTAEVLYASARLLSPAVDPENVDTLYHAAALLDRINLTEVVSELESLIPRLDRTISYLRNVQDDMY